MGSLTSPNHISKGTQTLPTPKVAVCLPLEVHNKGTKPAYCYHGGACKCDRCATSRQQQLDVIDKALDSFIPEPSLELKPGIRQAKAKPFKPVAKQLSPDFARSLERQHDGLRARNPLYYLPDIYYVRTAYKLPGPNHQSTQTEIRLGAFGILGCPCLDKSHCWD